MKNYLIIGGGIAGVTLAHQLENRNLTFDFVDNSPKYNSTKVAAGFWNPIVFKRLTMSFNADILMAKLKDYYPKVEQKLGTKFFHNTPQLKVFSTKEERHRFIDKAIVSEVSQFLDEEPIEKIEGIKAPFGMGKVIGTGYIDTVEYIEKSLEYFESNGSFINKKIDYSEIEYTPDYTGFSGKKYEKVIYCEGYHAVHNPLFPELRLKPTKGELLILEIPGLSQDFAFAKSAGLIPLGNQQFIVGSTYDWEDMTEDATEAARKKLLYNLSDFLELDYKVIDHQAGIRPSSFDRRPIIGKSSVQANVYIMNGLGTKGVMYAPFYSDMLINFIEHGAKLDEEVDFVRINDLN
ncbi:MAG: FAD-dependent oxidoreductase [Candidatus Kapaibacterium sp.]|nr:FAD-binding oxidoreductase [Ignavibacteria bacterium]